ncbi:MAG TPA: MaoC family dehydratase [Actinomycetaceae bacterium]|nr:MaoC family dehydratase [Actinomycetaceae bacterium]
MTTTVSLPDLPTLVGRPLGPTEYREVSQEQVNLFADATDDHQWIHTDPERAKDGPFGGPIAHGYLSLSLVIPFSEELLQVDGVSTKVNYGLDKVRFPAPVKVGDKVRMTSTITSVTEVAGGVQVVMDNVIETEGGTKPSVAATTLFRFYS